MRAAKNKPLKNKIAQRQNVEIKIGNTPARKEKLRLFRLKNEQGVLLTNRGVIMEFDSKRHCSFIRQKLLSDDFHINITNSSWRIVYGPDHRKYKGND